MVWAINFCQNLWNMPNPIRTGIRDWNRRLEFATGIGDWIPVLGSRPKTGVQDWRPRLESTTGMVTSATRATRTDLIKAANTINTINTWKYTVKYTSTPSTCRCVASRRKEPMCRCFVPTAASASGPLREVVRKISFTIGCVGSRSTFAMSC